MASTLQQPQELQRLEQLRLYFHIRDGYHHGRFN